MTPTERYRQFQHRPGFVSDPAQQTALQHLERLHAGLHRPKPRFRRQAPLPGLYLWGPVGRGKTLLMDLFCTSLPDGQALRLHFHRFMARIHAALRDEAGHPDPLRRIARRLAADCRVLCFDELQVSDIGDAMLLGRLFDELFRCGLVMVATSNQAPCELYRDGLHRDRFLPAIRLLESRLIVHSLDGGRDHRQREQTRVRMRYAAPADGCLRRCFATRAGIIPAPGQVSLRGRQIGVRGSGNGVIWFDFSALCMGPRSSFDYIELAQRFHTVLLSDVPPFQGEKREWIKARGTEDGHAANTTGERQVQWSAMDDPARRFISLVDELYDRQVKLVLSTAVAPEALYGDGRLAFEFRRTLSRLTEMASLEYQQRPHRP